MVQSPDLRFSLGIGGSLSISIKTSAPIGPTGDGWGDIFFANDLATSLRRRGHRIYIDRLGEELRPAKWTGDDVVIHLRGLHRTTVVPGAINILWVISHPELVDGAELGDGFDVRFAASTSWARSRLAETGVKVLPLLQATNPERFCPGPPETELASDVLFVGTSRNVFRPIVKDALSAGAEIDIYGPNWTQFIDARHIRADSLDNARTPAAYRSARVVLNDHWADMRSEGFLSNRLFDAVGAGAVVVSDDVVGLAETFGRSVAAYDSVPHLRELLSPAYPWPTEQERIRTAASIRAHHSFDVRARQLSKSIQDVMRARLRATLRDLLPQIRNRSPRPGP